MVNFIPTPPVHRKLRSGDSKFDCKGLSFMYVIRTRKGLRDHLVGFFPKYEFQDVNRGYAFKEFCDQLEFRAVIYTGKCVYCRASRGFNRLICL